MEIRTVLGGGEVHLDVVEGFALAEIVVVGGGKEARSVAPHDRLQEATVDVERQGLEPVHLLRSNRVGTGRIRLRSRRLRSESESMANTDRGLLPQTGPRDADLVRERREKFREVRDKGRKGQFW